MGGLSVQPSGDAMDLSHNEGESGEAPQRAPLEKAVENDVEMTEAGVGEQHSTADRAVNGAGSAQLEDTEMGGGEVSGDFQRPSTDRTSSNRDDPQDANVVDPQAGETINTDPSNDEQNLPGANCLNDLNASTENSDVEPEPRTSPQPAPPQSPAESLSPDDGDNVEDERDEGAGAQNGTALIPALQNEAPQTTAGQSGQPRSGSVPNEEDSEDDCPSIDEQMDRQRLQTYVRTMERDLLESRLSAHSQSTNRRSDFFFQGGEVDLASSPVRIRNGFSAYARHMTAYHREKEPGAQARFSEMRNLRRKATRNPRLASRA